MANYTTAEIQAVVDSIIRSSIRRTYDTLGVQRTDITFSDIQEAAAGVFLLYPKSPFYLVGLGGKRAKEVHGSVTTAVQKLRDALGVLGKRTVPVRDVSALVNAKAALLELEVAVTNKKPSDLTVIPAYARFNANIDRFLGAVGGNIKQDGQIVQTAEEARRALGGLVSDLEAVVQDFLQRCTYLAKALDDYNSLGLAKILSQTVVSNSRTLIGNRADQLSAMTEDDRMSVLRATVLDALSAKAMVKNFGSFPSLTQALSVTGTLDPYADTSRPGVPASVNVVLNGGLALVVGHDADTSTNILSVWLNGADSSLVAPSAQFFIPASMYPKVEGVATSPFYIGYSPDGTVLTGDLLNDSFRLLIDEGKPGEETRTISLTHNVDAVTPRTSSQVVAELTAGLTGTGFYSKGYFSPLMFDGEAVLDPVVPNKLLPVSPQFGQFPVGSIHVGDEVDFYYGKNAVTTRTVLSVDITPVLGTINFFTVDGATLLLPDAVTPPDTLVLDRIQYGGPNRRVRIEPDSLSSRLDSILNRRTIQVKQPTAVERNTGITLGFRGEVPGRGSPHTAAVLTDYVSKSSVTVGAATKQTPVWSGGTATSDISSALHVLVEEPLPADIAVDMCVVVPNGVNVGKYYISGFTYNGVNTNGVTVRSVLPLYRDLHGQAVALSGATIGYDGYTISSVSTATTSTVEIKGPADAGGYFTSSRVYGTTPYLKLSDGVRNISAGDHLVFYTVDSDNPTSFVTVVSVFDDGVVLVDQALPMNVSWSFTSGTVPFVRVASGKVYTYKALVTALNTQLSKSDANTTYYFRDLTRFINPLKFNTNPTHAEIGAAAARLNDLVGLLSPMVDAISAYQPDHVSEMDNLVQAFTEKGANRGVDTLVSCQFSSFFGFSQDQMSYAGTFQAAARAVAMNDLPILKSNRSQATLPKLVSTSSTPNYETSDADLDMAAPLDPHVALDKS